MMADESETKKSPRTHKDALLAELLGDVGLVHDLIKDLPESIGQIVANHETRMRGQSTALSHELETRVDELIALSKSLSSTKNVLIGEIASRAATKVREDTKFKNDLVQKAVIVGTSLGVTFGLITALVIHYLLK